MTYFMLIAICMSTRVTSHVACSPGSGLQKGDMVEDLTAAGCPQRAGASLYRAVKHR